MTDAADRESRRRTSPVSVPGGDPKTTLAVTAAEFVTSASGAMEPRQFAQTSPGARAVLMSDGRSLSYRELDADANRLAQLLRASGLETGDHIAFCVENRPEIFTIAWAAQRAGLYYTACSTRLTRQELAYIIEDCGARLFIASSAIPEAAEVEAPSLEFRLMIDDVPEGWSAFTPALAAQAATPAPDEAEGALMLYTSGTTGRPKGVKPALVPGPYPQPNPWVEEICELYGFDERTIFLSPAPLYHAAPLGFAMLVQRVGGTVLVMERFDAEAFLAVVEQRSATFALMVPTMFVRLLKLREEVRARYDVSSLTAALHGAAPCPRHVKERMIEWWGPIVHEYYGSTEEVGYAHCDSHEWLAHKGTVGRSPNTPVHIVGPDGEEQKVGEIGTLYFEGTGFEYHGDPQKTADARDPRGRGWTTLGDVGYVDEEGYLYLTDRKAHTIISGGVNIYPQESEDVLISHPAVDDVAVFGIPDEDWGERVHAVVQPSPDVVADDALAAQLVAYCRERLAAYKCPRAVEFRAELPRHETGKLYKRALKEEYWRGRSLTG